MEKKKEKTSICKGNEKEVFASPLILLLLRVGCSGTRSGSSGSFHCHLSFYWPERLQATVTSTFPNFI